MAPPLFLMAARPTASARLCVTSSAGSEAYAGNASHDRLNSEFLHPIDPWVLGSDGRDLGVDNRTCALRVIPGSEKSQRVEYRVAAADANPYLALAAAVGAGLWGIENEIEPEPAVCGNAYDLKFP